MGGAELVATTAVIGCAGVVQGVTGFAFALVSMGALPAVLGLRRAITLVTLLANLGNVIQLAALRREVPRGELGLLLAGMALGLPVGVELQARETPGLVTALGAVLFGYAAVQLIWRPHAGPAISRAWAPLAGLLGGVLGGALGTSGPPIVVYAVLRGWPPVRARAVMVSYFTVCGVAQLALYAWRGLIEREVLLGALALVPALVGGVVLGMRLAHQVSPPLFRALVHGLLLLLGLRLLGAG